MYGTAARAATRASFGGLHSRSRACGSDLDTGSGQESRSRLLCRVRHPGIPAHQCSGNRAIDEEQQLHRQAIEVSDTKPAQQLAEPHAPLLLECERDLVGRVLRLFQFGDGVDERAAAGDAKALDYLLLLESEERAPGSDQAESQRTAAKDLAILQDFFDRRRVSLGQEHGDPQRGPGKR